MRDTELVGQWCRLCMLCMALYPNDPRVRREAETLEREGIAVDIICLRNGDQAEVEKFGSITAYRILNKSPKESISRYTLYSSLFTVKALLKLQIALSNRRYDLVQAHNMPDYLLFAGILRKARGVPLLLDLHDLSVELFRTKWSGWKIKALIPAVSLIERLSCYLADHVITTSVGFKKRLMERGVLENKITLVLNTPDPRFFRYETDRQFLPIRKAAKLVYHGTVQKRHGLVAALEALALLQKEIPESILHVYGTYDSRYREELERKIRVLGLADYVFLHGWRRPEEICQIIQDSDIGIVPYLRDDFMNLATSTKMFEYVATGLPVVASRLPAATSIFDDLCIQFAEPGDARDLADKTAHLCLRPDLRKTQAQHALQALSRISGNVMAERYSNLVKRLINKEMA